MRPKTRYFLSCPPAPRSPRWADPSAADLSRSGAASVNLRGRRPLSGLAARASARPAAAPDPPSVDYIVTRVFTTSETRIHRDDGEIPFDMLEEGDRVTVRGLPKDDDIVAVDIERRSPAPQK